jgi:hypothetical protein
MLAPFYILAPTLQKGLDLHKLKHLKNLEFLFINCQFILKFFFYWFDIQEDACKTLETMKEKIC